MFNDMKQNTTKIYMFKWLCIDKRDFPYMILFILLCAINISCKTSASINEIPVRTETVIKERLVPVEIPADSAVMSALLECDSLNNVRLVEIDELKSKRVESSFNLSTVANKQSSLSYVVKTVLDTVYIPAKDSIIYQEIPLRVDVPVEVNRITGWQWFQIWAGRIFMFLWLIVIIYLAIKVLQK
jgi:hypothetical protein